MTARLETLPGFRMIRAFSSVLARLNRIYQPLGLRFIDAAILIHVSENPGTSQSEVCRLLDMASANMVPIVSRLVRKKLVVRERTDGRSFGLYLGPAGKELIQVVRQIRDEHEDWIASLLGPIDRDELSSFFLQLTLAAGASDPASAA